MAAAIKVFLLFIGAVIVKSHHLYRLHHRPGIHGFLDKIFHPGVPGFFGTGSFGNEDGHVGPVGSIELRNNHVFLNSGTHNGNYGQGTVVPNQNNYTIGKPNPPTPDVNLNIGVPDLNGHANVINANGQSDEPRHVTNVDHQADTNQSQLNVASDNVVGQNNNAELNTAAGNNAAQGFISENNQKEKKVLMGNEQLVPGFNDDDIKRGILMVDPELKYNTNEALDTRVPDINVAKESILQNNPGIIKSADSIGNEKKAPGFTSDNINMGTSTDGPKLIAVKPIDLKLVPGFHNDEIKNGVLIIDPEFKINDTGAGINKYSYIVFPDDVNRAKEQNQNNVQQSLPNRINTGDDNNQYPSVIAPGLDSTTAPPTNNIQWITPNNFAQTSPSVNNQGTQNQPSNVVFVQNPNEQVPVNNGNGSPYVHVIRDSNGGYTILNTPNNNGNTGQAYVPSNSGVNNGGQIYVPGNGNSGVNNPGQSYVITDTGNSGVTYKPGQIYVSGNSGTNDPGLIYVPGNSGASNPSQMYVSKNVPSSGSQTAGGYYNIIHLSNGQTVLVPVNNVQSYGNGQNAQWNGQSNSGPIYVPVSNNPSQGYQVLGNNPTGSVVNLGSAGGNGGTTNNVPLLISYKDKDGEDEEMSDQLKDEKSK